MLGGGGMMIVLLILYNDMSFVIICTFIFIQCIYFIDVFISVLFNDILFHYYIWPIVYYIYDFIIDRI